MPAFQFHNQTAFYQGKVRDVYTIHADFLVMIASDRISAFDVILPAPIPFKGQVLNQLAAFMLDQTKDICPNWLHSTPAPNASFGYRCEPFKVEVVVRGNLCGHAWRTYSNGQRILCGSLMADGLKENDFFPEPIITPSTKADQGHDEDISIKEIIEQGLCTEAEWLQIEGKEGQQVPDMSPDWIQTISKRYIELFEAVTGQAFQPQQLSDTETEMRINEALKQIQN
jgi:phosphoribosylaminoimidazole-succinocarboxamide synthase